MYPFIKFWGFQVQSYYLCAALAGSVGLLLASAALGKRKQGIWSVLLPMLVLLAALVGARLLNVITNPRAFSARLLGEGSSYGVTSASVWMLSYRKLSLMGGLLAGMLVIIAYSLLRRETLAGIADAFSLPAAVGIMILKLGCFLNGCCHGKPTDGPLGIVFPGNASKYEFINSLKVVTAKSPVVHPTQLYEMAGTLIAIAAAVMIPKKWRLREGSRAAIFIVLFAAVRWIVLPLRELPYDRQMITVFYPCLYAGMICSAAVGYLLCRKRK